MAKQGQAVVVRWVEGVGMLAEVVPWEADLVAWMEVRGFTFAGETRVGGALRSELQGQPKFRGVVGPCFGGQDTPLRYECPRACAALSQ
jgi:hypothetical protein